MRLTARGQAVGLKAYALGRVTRDNGTPTGSRTTLVYVAETAKPDCELEGYAAALLEQRVSGTSSTGTPIVSGITTDHLRDGDVVLVSPNGHVRTVFRPDSAHNVLFMTERCNSYCLMCSQPPRDVDDSFLVDVNLRLIPLMLPTPAYVCITGGEPTLLGDGLLAILRKLKETLPSTHAHMLTNGRRFADPEFTRAFSSVQHLNLSLGIPLYADNAPDHDYVVQARGAFDETMRGLYQLARDTQNIEIRVVLHSHTIERLESLCEYIYRNLPFASHVALMGLEVTGFAKHNLPRLWIDPVRAGVIVGRAAELLAVRGMNVSIYNYPLCLLPRSAWEYARRSISDWKQTYAEPCQECRVRGECAGLFQWAVERYSGMLRPVA